MLAELNTFAKNYEYLIKAVGAFLPFLIAIFMAYIAYQQWQTNERKRKHDLYEMRYEHIFNRIFQTINILENDADKYNEEEQKEINEILKDLEKYKFLIKKEDIKILYINFNDIVDLNSEYRKSHDIEQAKKIFDFVEKKKQCQENIRNLMNSYLLVEEDPKNLWQILAVFFLKIYYFLAFDKLIYNVELCLKKIQLYFMQRKNEILKMKLNKIETKI